jgi:hypothetical protein
MIIRKTPGAINPRKALIGPLGTFNKGMEFALVKGTFGNPCLE